MGWLWPLRSRAVPLWSRVGAERSMSTERRPARLIEGYLDTGRIASDPPRDTVLVRSDDYFPTAERLWHLGDVGACLFAGSSVDATPYRRGSTDPADEPVGIAVGYVVDGAVQVSQDGRTVDLRAGQLVLYDGATPFSLHSDCPHRYLVAFIPGQVLQLRRDVRDVLIAHDVDDYASTALLAGLLAALVDADPDSAPGVGQHMGEAIIAVVRALVAEVRTTVVGERSTELFADLVAWLDAHLADAGVTTERLAAEHFLSPRYIRKLFADHDTTVRAYLRRARLERIRNELLQPSAADLPVSAVAARWGFKDPSVFSRAFTRQFGQGPHNFRKDSVCGRNIAEVPP